MAIFICDTDTTAQSREELRARTLQQEQERELRVAGRETVFVVPDEIVRQMPASNQTFAEGNLLQKIVRSFKQ